MVKTQGKFVYAVEMPIRWYDMDAFGHVNNSIYLSYFEQARINWWMSITPPDTAFDLIGPVVINAHCTFLKALTYPDTLVIKLYVGPPGRSSYECFYEIYTHKHHDTLCAYGSTKVVWVDRKLEQSIPLPTYITKHLPSE